MRPQIEERDWGKKGTLFLLRRSKRTVEKHINECRHMGIHRAGKRDI
mgnify:CR=1 FL=1